MTDERDASAAEESTSFRANHSQGNRAVGGRIVLTSTHLVFTAHALDRRTGGRDLTIPLSNVRVASEGGRSLAGGLFSGGLRRRLVIELEDGSSEAFVVSRVEDRVAAVNSLL